jgi:plastocyanin
MNKFVVFTKKQILLATGVVALIIVGIVFYRFYPAIFGTEEKTVIGENVDPANVYSLITTRYEGTTQEGNAFEVFRFDPGTITVKQGEPVELQLTGIEGVATHPFVIEGLGENGTDISGQVQQGMVTKVQFTPEEKGTYSIVCMTHTAEKMGVPMVGYINVQ